MEIIPKDPPFGFLLFKRYLQARTGLNGPPFRFFRHCVTFFEIFSMFPKGPPFEFFVTLLQNACL